MRRHLHSLTLLLPFVSVSVSARNLCDEVLKSKYGQALPKSMSPQSSKSRAPACEFESVPVSKDRWELVWSDEFEGRGRPDSKIWKYETGGWGWFNSELQNYTDRIENSRLENGKLIIEARKEEYDDGKDKNHYTSAKLNSKVAFTYGRIEFRAKVPMGRGYWAAGWLFPEKHIYGKRFWPDNGEIDVLETVGHMPQTNQSSAHSLAFWFDGTKPVRTKGIKIPDLDTEFHDYVVEWLPNRMDFFVNGQKYHTVHREKGAGWDKWPYDQDFHIKINLAVGGNWGGVTGVDETIKSAKFELEYVRVYRPTQIEDCLPPDDE